LAVELKVNIEKMTEDDINDVLSIERVSFSHPWTKSLFMDELKNPYSHSYVLKTHKGEIIGYIIFWIIMDEGHILSIAVHPSYRNMGYGSLLLKFSLDLLQKKAGKVMTLEVRRSNIPAISLYRKFGFRVVGIRKNYYINNREDALVMEKEF